MQHDYILRMIEQFAQAIAAIVLRRKSGQHKEALEQIQTTSRYYLKMELDTLLGYTPEQIVEELKDPHKCQLCADLLYELALISEAKGQNEAALILKANCARLNQIAAPKDKI